MPLLIHSMAELESIVFPALELAGCRTVTEIGSESGGMTARLLEFAEQRGGWMINVDPAPAPAVEELLRGTPYGALHRDLSLRALPVSPPTDAYLIDGDHNYFTVLQELLWIERILARAGKPLLVFLHDVGWPWAYRDLYYNPAVIPAEWLHPHSWELGITLDHPGVIEGGFRGCGQWACALQEGGEKNGVRKAAEDLVAAREGSLELAIIPAVFGLGVLYSAVAPWSQDLRGFLAPYDRNPLLERLERNRLENYLRVIELQDLHPVPHTTEELSHAG
jgi:hypothetical protein